MNVKIDEDIKNGSFKRVYLLFGEERYLLIRKKQLLIQTLTQGNDMNFLSQSGKTANPAAVIDFLETMPFLANYRVALLSDTGFFSSAAPEALVSYIAEIPKTSILIFAEEKVDSRSRLYKAVYKHGAVVEYVTETEASLQNVVLAELKKRGKKIRVSVMTAFLERTGRSLSRVRNELDKLLAYTEGREEITMEDLDALTPALLNDNVFAMMDAFAAKDEKKTFSLYYELLENRTEPLLILAALTKQFRRLYQIRELYDRGNSQSDIASKLGMNPYAVKKNLPLAKQFSSEQLRRSYEDGVNADFSVKSGQMDKQSAVALFLAGHCR